MVDISNAAQDLFFKLRNRFPKINMGDEDSNATVDPEAARFFAFTYTDKESNRPYGQVTCSIIDNNSLKVYFDTQITADMLPEDKPYWFRFLRELRRMAKSHMLNFDVRDITKDVLSRQDLQYMTKLNPEKKKITKESITEGRVLWQRRGKVSEGDLNNVRIHVVHSEKMLENSNNRLLKVDRIFCVNENGEKFLLPFKSVSGAKAMANHISRGGNPYDTNGQVISRAVNEMRNLSRFTSATRTKTFESEQATEVISAAQMMKESIRSHLMRLTNNSRNFAESLEALNKLLPESEQDITELKGWFTTQAYNETLDNYLASAAGAYQRLKENAFEIAEAPADVEHKIMSPEFKLVLKADPAMDKLMTSRKYADNKALLTAVLGDVANRSIGADSDDIANFASMMGDLISSEGDAFGQRPDAEYTRDKKLAIMLAQKYMKDLSAMRSNPEYAASVRQDPEARTKMSARRGKSAGDEFEEAIMGMGQDATTMEAAKPDFLDMDKDGDKKEPMKKAIKDKEHKKVKEATANTGDSETSAVGNQEDTLHTESEENLMSKKAIEEMRRLAGLPVMENYIYATEEEDEEDKAEETGEMIDEIEADHEGMAAESEVAESTDESEEKDEEDEEEKVEEAADKSPKADKDYDGDGEIESEKDEVWGSRMKAAKEKEKADESIAWLQAVAGIRVK